MSTQVGLVVNSTATTRRSQKALTGRVRLIGAVVCLLYIAASAVQLFVEGGTLLLFMDHVNQLSVTSEIAKYYWSRILFTTASIPRDTHGKFA